MSKPSKAQVPIARSGLLRWVNALYPPNLIHILRSVNTDRLCYERKFLSRYQLGRREWGVIFPHGMGDLYMTSAYAEAVLAQKGGDGFVVFVKPQFAYIPALFKSVSRIVVVDDFHLARLQQTFAFRRGQLFSAFPLHHFLHVIGYKGVNFLDYYCLFLGLELGTQPSVPRPQTQEEAEIGRSILLDHGLRVGRTIILAPQASSTPMLPAHVWVDIASALKAQDFDVVTNTPADDIEPISGTVSMGIPIDKFIAVSNAAGWVISMRSGLCELLAHAGCRLTVLYPDESEYRHARLARGFSLAASGLRPDTHEVWYQSVSPGLISQQVLGYASDRG